MKSTTLSSEVTQIRYRKLQFETMESRLALSALSVVDPPTPSLDEIARLLEQRMSGEVRLDANRHETMTQEPAQQSIPVAVASVASLGDEAVVAITSVALDQSGETVTEFTPGEHYTLRVFIQDKRTQSAFSSNRRGVFRASVDLQFGQGVVPAGAPSFSDDFQSLRTFGIERTSSTGYVLENVGGVKASWALLEETTAQPEWLFDAPFLVDSEATDASIVAVPAHNDSESILVFGENSAIDPANVSTSQLQIPVIRSNETPSPPGPTTGPSPPTTDGGTVAPPLYVSETFVTETGYSRDDYPHQRFLFEALLNQRVSRPSFDDWFKPYQEMIERLRAEEQGDDVENEGQGLIELDLKAANQSKSQIAEEDLDALTSPTNQMRSNDDSPKEFELEELWGIALLLLEAEDIEPALGKYRMQFRLYSPRHESNHESNHETSNDSVDRPTDAPSRQRMIDVAKFLRPARDSFPNDVVSDNSGFAIGLTRRGDVARDSEVSGSRASAITFDLDALVTADIHELRSDRQSAAATSLPTISPRTVHADVPIAKTPTEN